MKGTLLFVVILGLFHYGSGTIYGLITVAGGNSTQTVLQTVQIDPNTGKFAMVARNIFYVGTSGTYEGISTFDQVNQNFFYATDFYTSFVLGVNVGSSKLLPPISIDANGVYANRITTIQRDRTHSQLLISGLYEDGSEALLALPDSGPTQLLFNFTTVGKGDVISSAVNDDNAVYYFAHSNATGFFLSAFAINEPEVTATIKFDCEALEPTHFFYSSAGVPKLIGVGRNVTTNDPVYFEVGGGGSTACSFRSLSLKNAIISSASFDPTTSSLYMAFAVPSAGFLIYVYNTDSHVIANKIPLSTPVTALEVSYSA